MDPRAKVCSQVKLGGGEMVGEKDFWKNLAPSKCRFERKSRYEEQN